MSKLSMNIATRTLPFVFAFGLGLATLATPAKGQVVFIGPIFPMTDLVDMFGQSVGEFTVGDKRFFDFEYAWTGDMPDPENITVRRIQDSDGNFGFRLQGGFADLLGGPVLSDALLTYKVEVLGSQLIIDAHLAGQPNLLGTTGSVGVTETFLPLGAGGEFTMDIYDDNPGAGTKLVDWVDFDQPYNTLSVQKDIHASAGDGTAIISFIDQTFSQVPEPGTLALLMIGLAVFSGTAVRRRK